MSRHECPAPQCDAQVAYSTFCCKRHWFTIPKPLRDELNRTWKAGSTKEWLAARKECVRVLSLQEL